MQENFRRRRLPHWDLPGATYFVTACLAGSIPAAGLLDIEQYRESLYSRRKPDHVSDDDWKEKCWKWTFAREDQWLDRSLAVRHLADRTAATVVVDSFYHFTGQRYDLLAYVVMPSHIHWVFTRRHDWVSTLSDDRSPRERIMHTLKLHTAIECNRHRSATGAFWQDESYDHCVLDLGELQRIIDYVELNPGKAGLVDSRAEWEFSSAHDRLKWGISPGSPLVRLNV